LTRRQDRAELRPDAGALV